MKRSSLSFKIISRILLFCIGLGLTIFSTYYFFTRGAIEKSTRENATALADNTINKIEDFIKPVEMIPDNLAWIIETGTIPRDSVFSFLSRLVEKNPAIYASAIAYEPYLMSEDQKYFAPYAFRNGEKIETTVLGSPEYNYFIMDWYQIPAMLKTPYWSEPYFDEGGADALLSTYSVPFYVNLHGRRVFGGIITIDISLNWLTDIVNSVRIFNTGYAFLISRSGQFVTHPDHSYIMNESIFTLAKELNLPELREIGRSMISGSSRLTSINFNDLGKVWISCSQLPSTKWSLGVVYPHREMYSDLHKLNLLILLLSAFGMGLLLIFTIRIINKQINPLTKFAKSARIIASGNFTAELPPIEPNNEMIELNESFEYMQKELANYIIDLKQTTSAKEKIESELRIAKEIQMGMIPHIFPPFPNLPEIDLYASLLSAREVGGDLYDFFLIDEHRLCFAIGDVSGKGIPASLFMAVTRTLLRSVADKHSNTAEIVRSVNRTLSLNNESNMFVTFFLGILNVTTGEIRYCNAGHNPPALISAKKEVNFLNLTKAIPLGLFEDFSYTEECIQIKPGDQLFLYTDGLTEAEDAENRLFGEERLLNVLRMNSEALPELLVMKTTEEISKHVAGHIQSDDLTMMSIVFYGNH